MIRPLHPLLALFLVLFAVPAMAAEKIAVLSTSFVLERKFKLLEEAARKEGVQLAWTQVDRGGEAEVRRVLEGARLVIIDAPRREDTASVERVAGRLVKEGAVPVTQISVMSPPVRMTPFNLDGATAQRVFDYYVAGTAENHTRLFRYFKTWATGGDIASVAPPISLANGGIYHPGSERTVFESLPDYLAWWEKRSGAPRGAKPVVGIEISSSYISDGQTRMLDETIAAFEKSGAVPLMFYRSSRSARTASDRDTANDDAATRRGGRPQSAAAADAAQAQPQPPAAAAQPVQADAQPRRSGRPDATAADDGGGRRGRSEAQAADAAAPAAGGRPAAGTEGAERRGQPDTAAGMEGGRRRGRPDQAAAQVDPTGFPNPKATRKVDVNEPLIMLDGKLLPTVMVVNTFIGGDPETRKAWHQAMGIPVIYVLTYRHGNYAAYAKDTAGVNSFSLPFTLTQAEYIGMQDPVMLATNEGGEMVPMAEQMDLLTGKVMKLARLQTVANAEKNVALLFWNHPPGEKNQGASNLNVPRSIEHLVSRLKAEGYGFDQPTEDQIIAAVADMLRPVYRKGGISDLMKTAHWDFIPLAAYRAWYAKIPDSVRADIEGYWGQPEKSPWVAEKDGVKGFVVPRMKLGHLVVMPQPSRGEMAHEEEEKKLFHDVKIPASHSYLATYLWIREQYSADAIVHFGTHGSQEWTPGKERGMWAFDYPQLLVGNTPVIYPYIVDNISEAIHVKRRGRGIIVSHQTPAFAPAGLSDDFVKINDLLREYQSLDDGLVKTSNKRLIVEQARKMNIHKDLKWNAETLEKDFDGLIRQLEDYLEDLGAAMQPLGLHTLGRDALKEHAISNVMQMLGQPLYEATGVKNARAAFRGDYKKLVESAPYRFVAEWVFADKPLAELADEKLRLLAEKGRKFAVDLKASWESEAVARGLSARWIDPSYGGDPIRNPDALHTGRNVYGFDPSRVPTKAAYEAGRVEIERLIEVHRKEHGKAPKKLTFSVWSTETMRHLGMLEGQIMAAMGVKPVWDEGGRVTGVEVISRAQLGRPRIDPVISITGLYRDQFPNVMERLNEGIVMVAALNEAEEENPLRANTMRIESLLVSKGADAARAHNFALTRIFGNESGNYGTELPKATLASDKWDEKDGKLAAGYLSRMSWGYGPDTAQWSEKLSGKDGQEINAYAAHLSGTDAAVFSRSSNLRGLLDLDHPFEYLGGISLAVRSIDGASPQLYISNMRDPQRAKLETAERFMANELRAVYQHPRWMAEMQKEGYSGTLKMLDVVNNFWGWQAMDRNVVRDDQWQEFHEAYVKDRFKLGMREWFDKANPTALAQITERMLEAIRKDYWKTDDQTKRELVEVYLAIAKANDVVTDNQTFKAYVAELAQGFGLDAAKPAVIPAAYAPPQPAAAPQAKKPEPQPEPQKTAEAPAETVRGQQMAEVKLPEPPADHALAYLATLFATFAAGMAWQAAQSARTRPRLSQETA